jgi:hypothetical protein
MDTQEIIERVNNQESFLLSQDNQYLGKLTLNKYDTESIFNEYGVYGSKYSATSIFNTYSNYGSPYSSLSPFNKYTNTPPIIYLFGQKFAYLSENKYLGGVVVDPNDLKSLLKSKNINN